MSETDGKNLLSNDELAVRLIQCAALVKKGDKGQLIRETIYDLTYYLTGKQVSNGGRTNEPIETKAESVSQASLLVKAPPPSRDPPASPIKHQNSSRSIHATSSSDSALSRQRTSPIKQVYNRVVAGDLVSDQRKIATAEKNAARFKAEVGDRTSRNDLTSSSTTHGLSSQPMRPHRPAFHRPTNPNSPLIANGWIEQHRRSKMRHVWKDVLASLVEGRKPGEETTLWIQRETGAFDEGKPVLEALHQIPVKWIEGVKYEEFSTDHRFCLRLTNLNEEFVFRCLQNEDAAQNWVATLRSAREVVMNNLRTGSPSVPPGAVNNLPDKEKPSEIPQHSQRQNGNPPHHQNQQQQPQTQSNTQQAQSNNPQQMSIKELRSLAHGAGVTTHGMERKDLERVVQDILRLSHPVVPSTQPVPQQSVPVVPRAKTVTPPPSGGVPQPAQPGVPRRQTVPNNANPNLDEDARKRAQHEEEQRRQVLERQRVQQENEKRMKEEEVRKKLEQERLRKDEEAHLKRVADLHAAAERQKQEELLKKQQEQYQKQQHEWQRQQAEAENQRVAAEQRANEERRRQEEAFRSQQHQQQQWHQQHPPTHPHQQQAPWNGTNPGPPNMGVPPNHHPQPFQQGQPHQSNGFHHPPPPGNIPPVNKYAKMAQQAEDDSQIALYGIKQGVLLQWALRPPTMQMLKPIDYLLLEMPNVFPPKFNVPHHEHFSKWTPLRPDEVSQGPGRPDGEKLTKVMRKLRLFLHPDKLPRDFSKEQGHLCKLLWDITSDAYEDFKKGQEDLSWIT